MTISWHNTVWNGTYFHNALYFRNRVVYHFIAILCSKWPQCILFIEHTRISLQTFTFPSFLPGVKCVPVCVPCWNCVKRGAGCFHFLCINSNDKRSGNSDRAVFTLFPRPLPRTPHKSTSQLWFTEWLGITIYDAYPRLYSHQQNRCRLINLIKRHIIYLKFWKIMDCSNKSLSVLSVRACNFV